MCEEVEREMGEGRKMERRRPSQLERMQWKEEVACDAVADSDAVAVAAEHVVQLQLA